MLGCEHSALRWFDTDEACCLEALALDEYQAVFQSARRMEA